MDKMTGFGHRPVFNDRPVDLLNGSLPQHPVHPAQGLSGACKKHRPAGWPVKAVDNTQENIPGLVVLCFDVFLQTIDQRDIA